MACRIEARLDSRRHPSSGCLPTPPFGRPRRLGGVRGSGAVWQSSRQAVPRFFESPGSYAQAAMLPVVLLCLRVGVGHSAWKYVARQMERLASG